MAANARAAQPRAPQALKRETVTQFLLLDSPTPSEVAAAAKYYACLDGNAVRGQKPPFIALNWSDAGSATIGYKPTQAVLSTKNGVFFKSFKVLSEAVDWTVQGYIPSVRNQLLKHIASQQ